MEIKRVAARLTYIYITVMDYHKHPHNVLFHLFNISYFHLNFPLSHALTLSWDLLTHWICIYCEYFRIIFHLMATSASNPPPWIKTIITASSFDVPGKVKHEMPNCMTYSESLISNKKNQKAWRSISLAVPVHHYARWIRSETDHRVKWHFNIDFEGTGQIFRNITCVIFIAFKSGLLNFGELMDHKKTSQLNKRAVSCPSLNVARYFFWYYWHNKSHLEKLMIYPLF